MANTQQITVGSGAASAIVAQSVCKAIRVMENRGVAGWPTTDYLVKKPAATSTGVRIPAGASYTFQCNQPSSFFQVGQTVGFLQTVSGTTTFDQDEDNP